MAVEQLPHHDRQASESDLAGNGLVAWPIFWTKNAASPDHLATILTTPEPWFEADTQRLEFIRRIHFWRYISGDETFDADYWLTRIENEYS